jgi:hypothetical protein
MLQVLGLARIGFCITDLEGVLQSADRIYSEIMHFDRIERGILSISDVTLPEDMGRLTDVMSKVSTSGASLVYRKPAIRGDGKIIWVENRLSILHSPHDKNFLVATRQIDRPKAPERTSSLYFPTQACAAYVADLATELSVMASDSNLSLTSEILNFASEIVQAEAQTIDTGLEVMAH